MNKTNTIYNSEYTSFSTNNHGIVSYVRVLQSYANAYVILDHKTSHKSLGYICSNSQKYTVWVKIIDFSFMTKLIRTLSKDVKVYLSTKCKVK